MSHQTFDQFTELNREANLPENKRGFEIGMEIAAGYHEYLADNFEDVMPDGNFKVAVLKIYRDSAKSFRTMKL